MKKRTLWMILLAMTGAYAMIYLDQSIVSVALPTIQSSLMAGDTETGWFINAYLLPLAIFVITGGKLGDIIGHRLTYLIGILGFGIASLFCGLAATGMDLIIARAFQGFFAALMLPIGQAVIFHTFPGEKRGSAMGFYGAAAVIFLAIGPFIGGLLTEYVSWRYIFFINVPIALLIFILTLSTVPKLSLERKMHFDILGQLLFALFLTSLITFIMQKEWISGLIALITCPFLITWQFRAKHPFINLRLFKNRHFIASTVNFFCIQFSWILIIFLSMYFQISLKYSAGFAGSLLLLMMLPQALLNPLAGKGADLYGSKRFLIFGFSLLTGSLLWLSLLSPTLTFAYLIPGLIAFFIALPLIFIPNFRLAMHAVPASKQGEGSGLGFAARQTGGTLGMATLGLTLARAPSFATAFSHITLILACISLFALILTTLLIKKYLLVNN